MFSVIASAAVVLLLITFLLLSSKEKSARKVAKKIRRRPKKVTGGGICGICFGSISKAEMTSKCACGQTFHEDCAEQTGCPYCGTPSIDLVKEMPDCVRCPSCGSDVTGNVCTCGAVVNRGGSFVCSCGNPLNMNDSVCGRCGTAYKLCSGRNDTEEGR